VTILLLRHGRTAANAGGLLLGRADPELDEEGRRQAVRLADELEASARGRIRQVVSSPLRRCQETAAVVARSLGVPVEIDERWIELDYGELDGVPVSDVPATTWASWMADVGWAPPGGESLIELGERVGQACDELVRMAADEDVAVITHVSPVKAAVAWALGVGDDIAWSLYVAPASITRIDTQAERRSLRSFNEIAHLR
jgi:broad specificity phosphatase PhoE